ncbi:MAG: T9SS type A sorting domain-containing protein [candidate division WOR-3 bacterium]
MILRYDFDVRAPRLIRPAVRGAFQLALWLLTFGTAAGLPTGVEFLPAGTEIVELRDQYSRHYSNGDGTITAEICPGPVRICNELGRWREPGASDAEAPLPTFEYEYATGHASTDGTQYGKTGIGLVKVEREVTLSPPSTVERVGWAKFNLTSLPDSVRITRVAFSRVIAYFEMTMGLSYRTLTRDPVTTDARTLYEAIENGAVCYEGERGRLYDTIDLGAVGVQHVQQSLNQNWVAFGIVGTGYSNILTKRVWIIGWNVQPRSDAPWLLVTYELPTAVAEPELSRRRLSVEPNPAKAGFVVVSTDFKPSEASRASLRLFDAAGRCVLSQTVAGCQYPISLDLRQLQAGTYLIQLEAQGLKATGRVTVQNRPG